MANISTYLKKILDAVYGEEVRGAIHDAIKAMNEESSNAMQYASTAKDSAQASATSAASSAATATQKATAAANSAIVAKISETNAKTSETNVGKSENAAKTSETNAKDSETAAKTSETNAKTSETNAGKSANAAKTSETNAKNSETAAKTSEINAKTSETNAGKSENAAKTSETNAKNSETAAKTSETNAKTSETNAANSAKNAKDSADSAKQYSGKPPKPDSTTKTWWIWDANRGEYVDSHIGSEIEGPQGVGISDIRLSSGDHSPGSTDIYTVEMTDGSTYNISVWQGRNGEGTGDVLGKSFDLLIPAYGWSDKRITVADNRLLALSTYKYFLAADEASCEEFLDCKVQAKNITTDGFITFTTETVPTNDLTVNVVRFELSVNG